MRVARLADGTPASPEEGGVFPPEQPTTSIKFPGEARGLFGAAIRKKEDGTYEGVKAPVFNYTGRQVVSMSGYNTAVKQELKRVMELRGVWRTEGYGYQQRYPDTWEAEVRAKVDQKLCNVKDLIDHVITESSAIYEGTEHANTFRIFHDGLSMWWDKDAQDYIRERGFYDRQLKAKDPTNHNELCKRYRNKLTGDSPELCRALDSHGFADLRRSIEFHCCLTSSYAADDGRKFLQGTPAQVFSSMKRCWEVAPSSERIVEDILKFEAVLDKIIAADGCMVEDEFLRTGRRGDDMDRKYTSIQKGSVGKDLKHKATSRQRLDTLSSQPLAVHKDAKDGYRYIMSVARGGAQVAADNGFDDDLESLLDIELSDDSDSEISDHGEHIDDLDIDIIDFLDCNES